MKRNANMLNGPLWSSLITYTVPIMITSILQLLFNAADLVVVGRFSGSINVAAVSATGAITNLIVNLFIGLSVGAGVTVAHALGGNHGPGPVQDAENAILEKYRSCPEGCDGRGRHLRNALMETLVSRVSGADRRVLLTPRGVHLSLHPASIALH